VDGGPREAIYGSEPGDVCEFITYGRQTRKGNNLYLILRFWDGRETLTLAGLETRVRRATLLTTGQELAFQQSADALTVSGLLRRHDGAVSRDQARMRRSSRASALGQRSLVGRRSASDDGVGSGAGAIRAADGS